MVRLLMIAGWHFCRLYHDCGGNLSALAVEVVVLMEWPSSYYVMKGRFLVIEEGLDVTGIVVAVLGWLVGMVVFRIVGCERRSVQICSIAESSSLLVRGVAWSMLFFMCLVCGQQVLGKAGGPCDGQIGQCLICAKHLFPSRHPHSNSSVAVVVIHTRLWWHGIPTKHVNQV